MTKENQIGWNFHNTYTNLPKLFYTISKPAPAENPEIVLFNHSLATSLGLNSDALQSEQGIHELSGTKIPKGAMNIAQAYAGHQFGSFTMLGDGRAIMLGEQITPEKERYDIQIKGAGRTFYSRGGDGLAAIGPMLREYLISEAMHALRIPTSRGLAVIKTTDSVFRETELDRGILSRVANSHLRVGTFQYAANWGDKSDVKELADYTMERHYPQLLEHPTPYLALLEEVTKQQAKLVAKWQLVGFIHGVMNTDNMSISGETIDYGPCAFMNTFDINTVFSSIDTAGRYKYGNQPAIANWNLARFAETLLPLIDGDQETAVEKAETVIKNFFPLFNQIWLDGMRAKLGLFQQEQADSKLVGDLLDTMKKYEADYTNTFLALTHQKLDGAVLYHSEEFKNWYQRYQDRLEQEGNTKEEVYDQMRQHNPALIPRNHLVEDALEAAVEQNDYQKINELLAALENPFAHTEEQEAYNNIPIPKEPFQTFCGT